MKRSYLAVLSISFFLLLGACSPIKYYREGIATYEIGEYFKSAEKLRKAYRKDKDPQHKTEIAFLTGEAYRKIGEYSRAAIWYRTAINRNYPDPIALLYYADCLRADQDFEEATTYYQQYLDTVPGDIKAINGLDACRYIPEWQDNPTRYIVSPVRELNSRYSDYSPVFVGGKDNEIIFTSTRDGVTGRRESSISGQEFADLFHDEYLLQKQKWDVPELLDESGMINTAEEEGAAALTSSGNMMIFTRARYDKTTDLGSELYSTRMSRGDWSEPTLINLLDDSLIVAHPAISIDGQTLYFASDRPGGFGGLDIWKATIDGNSYTRIINLGDKINTPGNEVFPTVDWNGNLYFSSDYHMGMGGLDIFKATQDETGEWQIQNMKSPINSEGDDFGMSFINTENESGMFSSNRQGSASDDIYSFYLPPKEYHVSGEIFDRETGQRMNDASIRIIGTDGTNLRMRADDGKFQMNLNEETEYVFAAYKDGYLNDKDRESTIGLDNSKEFTVDLYLTPTDAPININNINYEFGSWELLDQSKASLDSLIQILELNPTITIELMSHTDNVGTEEYNSELSQKRAQAVVDYLIDNGVNPDRLVAKGYGETWPKKVTRALASEYDFLKRDEDLTEEYISTLTEEQQEIANALNRRTEFRVLSDDFQETFAPNTDE